MDGGENRMKIPYEEKDNYSNYKNFKSDAEIDHWISTHMNTQLLRRYEQILVGPVLDIGCSFGYTLYYLSKEMPDDFHGMDVNARELENAKDFLERKEVLVTLHHHDITQEPFETKLKFNTILLFHILEHIYEEDLRKVMACIRYYASSEANVLVSMPYGRNESCPEHVNGFDCTKLIKMFTENGFGVGDCYREMREHGQEGGPCDLLRGVFYNAR